jgi:hypothetical protein
LPNQISKIYYQTELPNSIADIVELPKGIEFAKPNCQIDLEYQIIEFAFNSA